MYIESRTIEKLYSLRTYVSSYFGKPATIFFENAQKAMYSMMIIETGKGFFTRNHSSVFGSVFQLK